MITRNQSVEYEDEGRFMAGPTHDTDDITNEEKKSEKKYTG